MPFIGNTGKLDQIYLQRLDPQNTENQVRNIENLYTGDVEASNLFSSNLMLRNDTLFNPTHNFELGSNLWMDDYRTDGLTMRVFKDTQLERLFVDQAIGINNTNPTHDFDVADKFFIDTNPAALNLVVARGRVQADNIVSTGFSTTKVVIDDTADDVLTVSGNLLAQKVTALDGLSFGSNILLSDLGSNVLDLKGNVVAVSNNFRITGNLYVTGNVIITDNSEYSQQQNLAIEDSIIEVGVNGGLDNDTAIIFHQYSASNVLVGYIHSASGEELVLGRTNNGPAQTNMVIIPAEDERVNVHVYGTLWASNALTAGANTNPHPEHHLVVGSNVFLQDDGIYSVYNVANTFSEYFTAGEGITIGSNVIIRDSLAANVFQVTGNASFSNLFSTNKIVVANTNPSEGHTLCVGDVLHVHADRASFPHQLMVHGNTMSTNVIATSNVAIGLFTPDERLHVDGNIRVGGKRGVDANSQKSIVSTGDLVIHASDTGGDNLFDTLTLKSGPVSANVSAIAVVGAADAAADQRITFSTKNTERMRLTSSGDFGVSNTAPTEKITVGGNIRVNGSNAVILGQAFSAGNKSLKLYTDVDAGQSHIQSFVGSGKGLNFGVTSGSVVGNPKVTILDSGRVGIGVTQPQALLHTSGGAVYVNSAVTQNGGYDASTTPMTVTRKDAASTTPLNVFSIARDGSGSIYGSRADFALGRYASAGVNSNTRLDIDLADTTYNKVNCLTLRSDNRVGMGTHTPLGRLDVRSSGSRNALYNGIVCFNPYDPTNGGKEDSIVTVITRDDSGDPFSSYIVWNGNELTPDVHGWSVGADNRTDSDVHFRITHNVYSVSNVSQTALFIDGATSNVGIGTDVAPSLLTVNGAMTIGNRMNFRGLEFSGNGTQDILNATYDFNHSFIEEREFTNAGKSELLIFKGNDYSAPTGPDQIRHVAARHWFQVYEQTMDNALYASVRNSQNATGFDATPVLSITENRRVMINFDDTDEGPAFDATSLYVKGAIQVPVIGVSNSKFSTTKMDLYSSENPNINTLENVGGWDFQILAGGGDQALAIKSNTWVGIGTATPHSNVHLFADGTANTDVLTVQSDGSGTGTKKTGVRVLSDTGYGGYVRSFRTAGADSGLILGTLANDVETDLIRISSSGRVGVNTSSPDTGLHIYNKLPRVENSASNAIVEFKTTAGVANVLSDYRTGDLFLNPKTRVSNVHVTGSLKVASNISFGGSIEFGAQAGLGIGLPNPATALHVQGGAILNSDNVARKSYSSSFTLLNTQARDVLLNFGNGSFYAKVKLILREQSNQNYISTMVLEVSGGNGTGATPSYPIVVGTKNMFGTAFNPYPWSNDVKATGTRLVVKPHDTGNQRTYKYDVYVKVISSLSSGKFVSIQHDELNPTTLHTFTY